MKRFIPQNVRELRFRQLQIKDARSVGPTHRTVCVDVGESHYTFPNAVVFDTGTHLQVKAQPDLFRGRVLT